MSVLANVKVLLDLTDDSQDQKLEILLNQAEADALAYTKRDRLFGCDTVLEKMVIFLYNRLGTEGLASESYTGATYNYTNGYPDDIKAMLDDLTDSVNSRGMLITY